MTQHSSKVVVAMSGGVDSSVAAAILVREGYEVIGVTMQIWPSETEVEDEFTRSCCSLTAARDAMMVCGKLGIPHYVLNFKDIFQRAVIDDFIEEYRRGRTPNPCVRCNRLVKFDSLLTKARTLGAEFIATGHYSRIQYDREKSRWLLKRGLDNSKDQSYALYNMTQDQLAHTLMPLGGMVKDQTRRLAAELGLSIAEKPESQDICFVEGRNYPAFLAANAPETVRPGPIMDMSGNIVGEHQGIAFYTLGQRRRIGIASSAPLYVVRIDAAENAIYVGRNSDLLAGSLLASDLNFISVENLVKPIAVTAKVRYNMQDSKGMLTQSASDRITLTFEAPQRAITPGQAAVFYDGEDVIGGGTIDDVIR